MVIHPSMEGQYPTKWIEEWMCMSTRDLVVEVTGANWQCGGVWYRGLIGSKFQVRVHPGRNLYIVMEDGVDTNKLISMKDCKVVSRRAAGE